MPQYLYTASHAYPTDEIHIRYQKFYNTRAAVAPLTVCVY